MSCLRAHNPGRARWRDRAAGGACDTGKCRHLSKLVTLLRVAASPLVSIPQLGKLPESGASAVGACPGMGAARASSAVSICCSCQSSPASSYRCIAIQGNPARRVSRRSCISLAGRAGAARLWSSRESRRRKCGRKLALSRAASGRGKGTGGFCTVGRVRRGGGAVFGLFLRCAPNVVPTANAMARRFPASHGRAACRPSDRSHAPRSRWPKVARGCPPNRGRGRSTGAPRGPHQAPPPLLRFWPLS